MGALQDAQQIAALQAQANATAAEATAKANRVNETNAFGSVNYSQSPDGTWQKATNLSPEQQALFDQKNQILQQALSGAQGYFGNTADVQGLTGIGSRERIEDALMERFSRQMDPQFAQQQEAMAQDLAQRGIPLGSELHNKMMDNFMQQRSNAFLDANTQAIQLGGQEQDRMIQQALMPRNMAMGDLQFAMQGAPGSGTGVIPGFGDISQVQINPADITNPYTQLRSQANSAGIAAANRSASAANAAAAREHAKNMAILGHDLNKDYFKFTSDINQGNQPKQPSTFEQIVGGVAPGIGYGFGAWGANQFG